jgi:hypothetical protein
MRTRWMMWLPGLVLVLGILVVTGLGSVPTVAQEAPEAGAPTAASGSGRADTADVGTPEQMAAADALAPSDSSAPVKRFFPTVDPADYAAAKAAPAAAPGAGNRSDGSQGAAPQPYATPPVTGNFEGVNAGVCCLRPPDTHGAVGPSHFVEVVNNRVVVFNKAGAVLKNTNLSSFFGTTEFLFDPRVVYDPIWNRWVILATRLATAPTDTVRRFRIAASLTSDPTGSFFRFTFNFSGSNGDWWDYPGLGFDQDAVIVTGNVFHCTANPCGTFSSFVSGRVTPIAKARLYNGLGFGVPIFSTGGSPQPPLVLDQNNIAVIARVAGGSTVQLFRLANGSNASQATFSAPFNVNVGAYSIPPVDAAQPGTVNLLDTLDGRFQNASTQFGGRLYQVHTVNLSAGDAGPRPTPRIYSINWGANALIFADTVFANLTSYDFNPSIAASAANRALVVWTSTRTGASPANAQVRVSGKDAGDFSFPSTAGSFVFGSGTFYNPTADNPERWGDYSAVSVDPSNSKRFWFVNERIINNAIWGSRFGHATFP